MPLCWSGKRDYPDRAVAAEIALILNRRNRRRSRGDGTKGNVYPYHCSQCNLWHVGHKIRRAAIRIERRLREKYQS